jgi:hypothetical protein
MTEEDRKPLCEAICEEIEAEVSRLQPEPFGVLANYFALSWALPIIRQHFAALTVEEVARVISGVGAEEWPRLLPETRAAVVRASKARDVMKLLRKE